MSEFIISVLGGVVQDFTTVADRLPLNGETYPASHFEMQPGGKGSNSAVAIHRLTRFNPRTEQHPNHFRADRVQGSDVRVRMVGAVGKDNFGPDLIENLKDCGINTEGIEQLEGQTAVANILVESETGANSILQYPGVNAFVKPERFTTPESLGGGKIPHLMVAQLELNRDAIEQAIETAGRNGVPVLLNPSPAHYLMPDIYRNIAHLVMNETEAFLLADCEVDDINDFSDWESIAVHFHRLSVDNVVITLGEKGAYYSTKQNDKEGKIISGFVDAEKGCKVVDTSGAGDSFVGGYIAQYCQQRARNEWNIEAAVKYGCKAAARIIESFGCLRPIPWADELDEVYDDAKGGLGNLQMEDTVALETAVEENPGLVIREEDVPRSQ